MKKLLLILIIILMGTVAYAGPPAPPSFWQVIAGYLTPLYPINATSITADSVAVDSITISNVIKPSYIGHAQSAITPTTADGQNGHFWKGSIPYELRSAPDDLTNLYLYSSPVASCDFKSDFIASPVNCITGTAITATTDIDLSAAVTTLVASNDAQYLRAYGNTPVYFSATNWTDSTNAESYDNMGVLFLRAGTYLKKTDSVSGICYPHNASLNRTLPVYTVLTFKVNQMVTGSSLWFGLSDRYNISANSSDYVCLVVSNYVARADIYHYISGGITEETYSHNNVTLAAGTWHTAVIFNNGAYFAIYLDGVLLAKTNSDGGIPAAGFTGHVLGVGKTSTSAWAGMYVVAEMRRGNSTATDANDATCMLDMLYVQQPRILWQSGR